MKRCKDCLSTSSFPRWQQRQRLGQEEIRSLELYVCLQYGWQGPRQLGIFCYFPRNISRELDWNWCPYGMLSLQEVADSSAQQHTHTVIPFSVQQNIVRHGPELSMWNMFGVKGVHYYEYFQKLWPKKKYKMPNQVTTELPFWAEMCFSSHMHGFSTNTQVKYWYLLTLNKRS